MFLCASRLPSFAPGAVPLRGSKSQVTAGTFLPDLGYFRAKHDSRRVSVRSAFRFWQDDFWVFCRRGVFSWVLWSESVFKKWHFLALKKAKFSPRGPTMVGRGDRGVQSEHRGVGGQAQGEKILYTKMGEDWGPEGSGGVRRGVLGVWAKTN